MRNKLWQAHGLPRHYPLPIAYIPKTDLWPYRNFRSPFVSEPRKKPPETHQNNHLGTLRHYPLLPVHLPGNRKILELTGIPCKEVIYIHAYPSHYALRLNWGTLT